MDRFDRETNERNLRNAIKRLEAARTFVEAASAQALIHSAAEAEIRRLKEKERLMRLGFIRERINS
jgi:hypothetical protein